MYTKQAQLEKKVIVAEIKFSTEDQKNVSFFDLQSSCLYLIIFYFILP